jgi:hypothetical protein
VPLEKLLSRFPRTQAAIHQAAAVADLTVMVDNSLDETRAFEFVRAQRKRHVLFDVRDPRYDADTDVLAASGQWLDVVAGPFREGKTRS